MATIKLRWLVKDTDARGNDRYYVRMPGKPKYRLRGEPGSSEFMDGYNAAVDGRITPRLQKVPEGSFEWLCRTYFNSTNFKSELGLESQKVRRRILEGLCRTLGDKPFHRIETRHVRGWMDARADRPEAANGLLKALRGLFAFAVIRGIAKQNPVELIKKVRVKTEGFHTWTVEEVRQYEAFYPIGTTARLAMAMLLFTGSRRGDVVKIGRQHIQDGLIVLRQGKSRRGVHLPILPELQQVLEATTLGNLTYIVNQFGNPFTAAGFGARMRKWCNAAGLPHCTSHGLRKAGAVIAAENGATDRQLMAIFGWAKADMATLYTQQADRKRQAAMGMPTLVSRTETVPTDHKTGTKG